MDPQSGSGSDKIVFSHLITPLNYEKIFSLPKYRVGSRSYRIQIQYAVFTDEQNIFEIFLKILAFPRAFFYFECHSRKINREEKQKFNFLAVFKHKSCCAKALILVHVRVSAKNATPRSLTHALNTGLKALLPMCLI